MFTEVHTEDAERWCEKWYEGLAESILEMSESQVLREARESGEEPSITAKQVRSLLATQVKQQKERIYPGIGVGLEESSPNPRELSPLALAMLEYRRQVQAMEARRYALPETAEERRVLMESLFQRYPEMHSAFLTVQHREFKNLSDKDIESFLKQLQELDVLGKDVWVGALREETGSCSELDEEVDEQAKSRK